jgi:hypothetical protein
VKIQDKLLASETLVRDYMVLGMRRCIIAAAEAQERGHGHTATASDQLSRARMFRASAERHAARVTAIVAQG